MTKIFTCFQFGVFPTIVHLVAQITHTTNYKFKWNSKQCISISKHMVQCSSQHKKPKTERKRIFENTNNEKSHFVGENVILWRIYENIKNMPWYIIWNLAVRILANSTKQVKKKLRNIKKFEKMHRCAYQTMTNQI